MNFKHVLIGVAVLIVAIVAFKFFTRIDRTDPIVVATGFTDEMKSRNIEEASEYVAPDLREAWLTAMNAKLETMKSGQTENYFAAIPEAPGFGPLPAAPGAKPAAAGIMNLVSSDKTYTIDLSQVEGDWYVSKTGF